jgi:4-amino-4-deoxy-L-arabinose transferase-like glycosyltransferase
MHRDTLTAGALTALVAGTIFFLGLGAYPLLDPDEARHAEVAREMATAKGVARLFLPTLELRPYREKPAGYYWLVTMAYGLAGVDEGAARAVSATAALVTVLTVFAWAAPRAGPAGAAASALLLATSVGWLGFSRYANLDMTLTACVTVGVLAGLAWLDRAPPRRPPLAPWIAAGLGMLVKGPIAAALILGPLALAVLLRAPRPGLRELGLARGVLVMVGIAAVLYGPLAVLDRSYLVSFAATNLRRFSAQSRHAAPVYYYLLWLPLLFLPWTLFAVPPLVRAARDPARRALVLWAAFVPALLTLPRGKLASYALSALVPLALVAGPDLVRGARTAAAPEDALWLRLGGWLSVAVLVVVAAAAVLVGLAYPVPVWARVVLAAAAFAWAAAVGRTLRAGRPGRAPALVLGAVLTLYPLAITGVAPAVAALYSHRDAARLIAASGHAPVIAFSVQAPSLVFYLGRPLLWTEDQALVSDLFAADAPVFLVTGFRHFATIEQLLGERAHVWWATPRRRVYANVPPPAANGSP